MSERQFDKKDVSLLPLPDDVWVVCSRADAAKYSADFVADYRHAAMEHAAEMSENEDDVNTFGPFRVGHYINENVVNVMLAAARAIPSASGRSAAERAIEEHNKGCLEACGKTTSEQYVKDSRRCDDRRDCPDCPKDWMIQHESGPASDELLAIHHAVMNPMEATPQDCDTFTVKRVKEFIQRAVGTDPFAPSSTVDSDELVKRLRQEVNLMRSRVVNEEVRKVLSIPADLMEQAAARLALSATKACKITPLSADEYRIRQRKPGQD